MNKYKVYFQFFGKKMQSIIEAEPKYDAEEQVAEKLHIVRCDLIEGIEEPETFYSERERENLQSLKDMFGFK